MSTVKQNMDIDGVREAMEVADLSVAGGIPPRGAAIMTKDGEFISSSWNQVPSGMEVSEFRWLSPKGQSRVVVPAEVGAICRALELTNHLRGATLYVVGLLPAGSSVDLIAKHGISRVVCCLPSPNEYWWRSGDEEKLALQNAGVEVTMVDAQGVSLCNM